MSTRNKKNKNKIPILITILILIFGIIFIFMKLNTSTSYKESINFYTGDIFSYNYNANLIDNLNEDNTVISPLMINKTLVMFYYGSDNNTKKEIKNYFHKSEDEVNSIINEKIKENTITKKTLNDYEKNYESLIEKLYKEGYSNLTIETINKLEESDKEKILLLLKKISLNYEGMYNEKRMSIKNINKYTLSKKDINYNSYYIKNLLDDTLDKYESYKLKTEINYTSIITYNKNKITWNTDYQNKIKSLNIELIESNDDMNFLMTSETFFSSEWEKNINIDLIKNIEFQNTDDTISAVEMMFSEEMAYYENNYAVAFKKNYQNTKYSFVGILPKQRDYKASNLNIDDLLHSEKKGPVRIGIPRFSLKESVDLRNIIPSGTINLNNPNLTKSSEDTYEMKEIQINTTFEIGDKGTTNTQVGKIPDTIEKLTEPKKDILLNKPFFFLIINNDTNDCIMIGKISKL